jgi:methionyl-tRNA formyltransferase
MHLVFFGTDGPLSVQVLRAIGADHRIVGVVRALGRTRTPPPESGLRRIARAAARAVGWRPGPALARMARALDAPVWETRSGHDPEIATRIAAARADLVCIAGFPWLLDLELLAIPTGGAVNVHAALLPRHRGPLPLFWIYYHDDRETGVTVHRVTQEADAGEILGQLGFPLPRGFPVERLNRLNAERGAGLIRRTLAELASGRGASRPQDETRVTLAPMVRAGDRMIDFERWGAERVWHFCAGLFPRFVEPLALEDGRPLRYGAVLGYDEGAPRHPAGRVTRALYGYDLHCRDGRVRLGR